MSVRDTLSRRISRVAPVTSRVLSMASVIGREFSLPVLIAATQLTDVEIIDSLDEALASRLVVEVPGAAERFAFRHALIREVLYHDVSSARRARMHRAVAEALERTMDAASPPYADLAHHYLLSGAAANVERAISNAIHAGEHAVSRLAHEEAARYYAMAMQALETQPGVENTRRLAELSARRGRAFSAINQWQHARGAFERALELVGSVDEDRRAEILIELAHVLFRLLDTAQMRVLAEEGLQLAERLGRRDLATMGLALLARGRQADGDLLEAIELDRQALAKEQGAYPVALCHAAMTHYLIGKPRDGLDLGRRVAQAAREARETGYIMYALPSLAIALAGCGQYREGAKIFDEALTFGRDYGIGPLRARAMAMSAGFHLDLFDYERAEAIQQEARDLARSVDYLPPIISAGIDLLLTYARTGEVAKAEQIRDEVAETVRTAKGWHGWLWRLRFSQALAEIALAKSAWHEAIEHATAGISDSVRHRRRKYHAFGLATRATALHALGQTQEAVNDLGRAAAVAAETGDPALELRVSAAHLAIERTEAVADRAVAQVQRVLAEVPTDDLKTIFLSAAPVQLITRS